MRIARPGSAAREPQQDRGWATRTPLLESAISCLAELGWSGATVSVIAQRAGVSRGATQHYFPTREAPFTAALEHMAEVRSEGRKSWAKRPGFRRAARTGLPTWSACSSCSTPARCSVPRCRSRPPPRPVSCCGVSCCRSRPGSAGRHTRRPSSCSTRTSLCRACTRRCRRPSTWPADSVSPARWQTTRAGGSASSGSGLRPGLAPADPHLADWMSG